MENVLFTTYQIALPIILGYIVWLLKDERKKRGANAHGTMLLLRVQLIEYHDKYCKIGEAPSYVYDNFVEMYDCYKALGGNGMITKMREEFDDLQLKDSRKE